MVSSYFAVKLFKRKVENKGHARCLLIHGVTGTIGSLSIGVIASSAINPAGPNGWLYGNPTQLIVQSLGVADNSSISIRSNLYHNKNN